MTALVLSPARGGKVGVDVGVDVGVSDIDDSMTVFVIFLTNMNVVIQHCFSHQSLSPTCALFQPSVTVTNVCLVSAISHCHQRVPYFSHCHP